MDVQDAACRCPEFLQEFWLVLPFCFSDQLVNLSLMDGMDDNDMAIMAV